MKIAIVPALAGALILCGCNPVGFVAAPLTTIGDALRERVRDCIRNTKFGIDVDLGLGGTLQTGGASDFKIVRQKPQGFLSIDCQLAFDSTQAFEGFASDQSPAPFGTPRQSM